MTPTKNINHTKNERKWYLPSNDQIFKLLWRLNPRLLAKFILAIINSISSDELEPLLFFDTEQQVAINAKLTRLDIQVCTKLGTMINIEMQNRSNKFFPVRVTVYLSQNIASQREKEYGLFKKVINLSVANYIHFSDDDNPVHSINLREKCFCKSFTDIMEIYIFETLKAKNGPSDDPLTAWGKFFSAKTREDCMEAAQLNQDVEQAFMVVDLLNMDDRSRALAEAEERINLDKLDAYKEGEENGIKIGEVIKQENIARNLLKVNIPIHLIVQTTGLSKEEVESLKTKENVG